MNSRNTKITVDVLMTVFLILSFIRWEGDATFHFSVGTVCALLFAIHVFIQRKWLRAVTKSCLAGKLTQALKLKYAVDVLLLAAWIISIAAGFLAIGSFLGGIESMAVFGRIHGVYARLGLLLVVIHVVQHRDQIFSYLKIRAGKK
ncbi:MAG: hypothetical protein FWE20_06010 [Defluviitaleaceae bacterium]|nr:hypothetical protein [Defluviitaleaceae bacterium]